MRVKPKAAPVVSAINVIPMADIMLVLLIIFMVITPMMHPGHDVDMAAVNNPREMKEAEREDAVILAMTRDGAIYLGADRVSLEQIGTRIRDIVVTRPDQTIFVKSDGRAKYGVVVALVDEIRAGGADRLGLLTEKSAERRSSWE